MGIRVQFKGVTQLLITSCEKKVNYWLGSDIGFKDFFNSLFQSSILSQTHKVRFPFNYFWWDKFQPERPNWLLIILRSQCWTPHRFNATLLLAGQVISCVMWSITISNRPLISASWTNTRWDLIAQRTDTLLEPCKTSPVNQEIKSHFTWELSDISLSINMHGFPVRLLCPLLFFVWL